MADQTESQKVRVGKTVSDEERNYMTERRRRIHKWLQKQGFDCELDEVPNVALLGSGGGERASVGMLGSLMQLQKDGLLDGMLYLAGVSGTTWCMASVYDDPAWSKSDKQFKKVIDTLNGPAVDFHQAVTWLRQRKEIDEDFDLTTFWAAMTGATIVKKMDTKLLSDQAHRNSVNPYPIYSTIERYFHHEEKRTKEMWFEMSPHESGFSGVGAYIYTSTLRSNYEEGTLKEQKPQIDMLLVQGFCGSAIADFERDMEEVNKLLRWIFGCGKSRGQFVLAGQARPENELTPDCNCKPSQILDVMHDLLEITMDRDAMMQQDSEVLDLLKKLENLLDDHVDRDGNRLWSMDLEQWEKYTLKEREQFILSICQELIHTSERWPSSCDSKTCHCYGGPVTYLGPQREVQMFPSAENEGQQRDILTSNVSSYTTFMDIWWVMQNISPLLLDWTWGTTSNFLYRFQDQAVPPNMASNEDIYLIDAGLMNNSPYPPVLRPERKVDLIISLDFSDGDPFETVFLASEYAEELHLAFPKLDPEVRKDKESPKDYYIFPGQQKEPTVIHMPLFNLQNCQGKSGINKERKDYKTAQLPYSAEKITHLLEKAQTNIKNNKDRLLNEIKKAVLRKRSVALPRGFPVPPFQGSELSGNGQK